MDHESLYLALRSRRTALSTVGNDLGNGASVRLDLFDPAGTGSGLGWRTATLAAIDEYFPIWDIGGSAGDRQTGSAGIKRSELSHER